MLQGSNKFHLTLQLQAKFGQTGLKSFQIAAGVKLAFYFHEMVYHRKRRSQVEALLEPVQTRRGDVVSFRGGEDSMDKL